MNPESNARAFERGVSIARRFRRRPNVTRIEVVFICFTWICATESCGVASDSDDQVAAPYAADAKAVTDSSPAVLNYLERIWSHEGAEKPSLDAGIAIVNVRLDKLREAAGPQLGAEVLHNSTIASVVRTYSEHGKVVGGIQAEFGRERGWSEPARFTDVGGPFAEKLAKLEAQINSPKKLPNGAICLYSIRALNLNLLGYERNDTEYVVPVTSSRLLELEAGKEYKMLDVIPRIIDAAKHRTDTPGG
jgi:hypothetical protein